jgi:hypothetical protein
MASTFTSRLKLERQASGENAGNWGNLVNYVFNRIDSSVRGYVDVDVAGSANVTLTSNNSTSNTDDSSTDDQVHNKVLEFTGALTGNIHVFTDAVEGEYIVFNNTSGSQTLTFAPTGGTGVLIAQGQKTIVYTDGTTMNDVLSDQVRDSDIGVTVQAYSAKLDNVSNAAVTDGNFLVGDGTDFVAESGATARTSLGLGTASDVEFNDAEVDSLGVGTPASSTTGEIRATNDITAFYSSDVSLKENIINIPNPLEAIRKLNGVLFDWKKSYIDKRGGEDGYFVRKRDVGVIAQEVEKVLPEAVAQRSDGIKAVKYDRLTCLLIEAVKVLSDKIQKFEEKK